MNYPTILIADTIDRMRHIQIKKMHFGMANKGDIAKLVATARCFLGIRLKHEYLIFDAKSRHVRGICDLW